jgi:methyl-accepting chemotaxis protein
MRNWKIGFRISAAFGVVILICAAMSYFNYNRVRHIDAETVQVSGNTVPSVVALSGTQSRIYRNFIILGLHAATTSQAEKDQYEAEMAANSAAAGKALKEYESFTFAPGEAELYEKVKQDRAVFNGLIVEVKKVSRGGDAKSTAAANQIIHTQMVPALMKYTDDFQAIVDLNNNGSTSGLQRVREAVSATIRGTVIGMLLAIGLAALITVLIVRSISKPLAQLAETAKHISLGDVSQTVDYRAGDEVGSLADSFRAMVEYIRGVAGSLQKMAAGDLSAQAEPKSDRDILTNNLNALITAMNEITQAAQDIAGGDLTVAVKERSEKDKLMQALASMVERLNSTIRDVADHAANASSSSQQLAAASGAIASGAQEQAASLEETSASLEEITATVRQSADNAQQASQLAVSSKDAAVQGQEVVAQAITAMSEINAASAKIADIISTIDEIAFQTNLLAVNAAVEAARAGDEGRGFAVVASEVRSLAQRSAVAAKEIKVLIQDSLRKVDAGSTLVNRSGETLHGIVGSVKRVTDIVNEMAAAAIEQSTGIEQVSKAMTQLDQVTQSNSAQTEELSATAQSLSEQAVQLSELVGTFNVGNGGKDQRSRHNDSYQAETQFAHPNPVPRQAVKALRSNASAKASSLVRSRTVANRSVHPSIATTPPTGSNDASFEEF